jgi:hypothetical protein
MSESIRFNDVNVSNDTNINSNEINNVDANTNQEESIVHVEEESSQEKFIKERFAHYKKGPSPYNVYKSTSETVKGFTMAFRIIMAFAILVVAIFVISSLTKLDAFAADETNIMKIFHDRGKLFTYCGIIGLVVFVSKKYNVI